MNLRDLRYLVALARYEHFGKAADACFVTQPTLSAQIKKLEEFLGVALVERNRRNVRLTEVGKLIAERASVIDAEAQSLIELAQHFQDPLQGKFRLGVIPTLGPYVLPLLMPKLKAGLPRVDWVISESQTSVLQQQLMAGEIDACLLATPEPDGCDSEWLLDERFYLAMPSEHAMANKDSVSLAALEKQSLLLLEDGHCLRDQTINLCEAVGLQENAGYRATSLETLRHMVGSGAGVTLLPYLATQGPWADMAEGVVIKPIQGAPTRCLRLVWRSTSPRVALMAEIASIVKAVLAEIEPASD